MKYVALMTLIISSIGCCDVRQQPQSSSSTTYYRVGEWNVRQRVEVKQSGFGVSEKSHLVYTHVGVVNPQQRIPPAKFDQVKSGCNCGYR